MHQNKKSQEIIILIRGLNMVYENKMNSPFPNCSKSQFFTNCSQDYSTTDLMQHLTTNKVVTRLVSDTTAVPPTTCSPSPCCRRLPTNGRYQFGLLQSTSRRRSTPSPTSRSGQQWESKRCLSYTSLFSAGFTTTKQVLPRLIAAAERSR